MNRKFTLYSYKKRMISLMVAIIMVLSMICMGIQADAAATITYNGQVSYGASIVGSFTVNGRQAFCIEHDKASPPTGTAFHEQVYENANIRKALYYGWGGPKQWSGFTSSSHGIVATSLVLSHYYSGTSVKTACKSYYDWLQSQPAVANSVISFSKTSTTAYLTTDKTKQRTENIKFNGDSKNYITMTLGSGVTLHNVTRGTTATGSARLYGGDTFYLTAPLSTSGTWTSAKMTGSVGKYQPVVCVTSASGVQNLGYGRWADDPENFVQLKVNWIPHGKIQLQKTDKETGKTEAQGSGTLKGAVYEVFNTLGVKKATLITDAKGTATSGLLPYDTYTVKEKTPSKGYLVDIASINCKLNASTVTISSKEQIIRGDIELMKFAQDGDDEDTEYKNPLADVEFTLTHGTTGEQVVIKTNKDGKATTKSDDYPRGRLVFGEWTLEETKTPEGYVSVDPITFDLNEDGWFKTYIIEDKEVHGALQVVKKDISTGKTITMAGTTFKIIDTATGEPVEWQAYSPAVEKYTEFTTDANGQFTLPNRLQKGDYELVEVSAPTGYLYGEPIPFTIGTYFDWSEPLTLTMEDENAMGVLRLKKTDEETKKAIAGAEYNVLASEDILTNDGTVRFRKDDVVATLITDEEGEAYSSELYFGNYEVVETKAPAGYILDKKKHSVSLTYENQETEIVYVDLAVTDKPTTVEVQKMDAENKEALDGVEFAFWCDSLLDTDVEVNPDIFQKQLYTTDKEGRMVFKYLFPGTYCLQEKTTLPGYVLDNKVRKFTVDKDGNTDLEKNLLVLENHYTTVEFYKQDKKTKETLSGGLFELLDSKGKVVDRWTSCGRAYKIDRLPVGEYSLHELSAPGGYQKTEVLHFSVKAVKGVQKVILYNEKIEPVEGTSGKPPKTGDHSELILLIALLLGAGIAGGGAAYYRRRTRESVPEEETKEDNEC